MIGLSETVGIAIVFGVGYVLFTAAKDIRRSRSITARRAVMLPCMSDITANRMAAPHE